MLQVNGGQFEGETGTVIRPGHSIGLLLCDVTAGAELNLYVFGTFLVG